MDYASKTGERRMGMTELLKAQEKLDERVEGLEEAIRGNGKPGINQRLALIEAHLARMDYWGGVLVKVMLPVLLMILALGITAWVQSVT